MVYNHIKHIILIHIYLYVYIKIIFDPIYLQYAPIICFYVYVLRRLEISGFRRSDPHLQMDFPASAMMGTLQSWIICCKIVFLSRYIHGVYISSQCIRETNEFMDEVYS